MKPLVVLALVLLFSGSGSAAGFLDALGFGTKPDAPKPQISSAALNALSQDQVVQGLKEALSKGLTQAVGKLGHDGGFLTNLNVKIPIPEKMRTIESTLRALKQDQYADEFITTMNRAAEQAVPAAAPVFVEALQGMTIDDAKSILSGTTNAATLYFRKATEAKLTEKFLPIVKAATDKTGVTLAYKQLMAKANPEGALGSFGSSFLKAANIDTVDVDSYVTSMALDGLFKMVAEEEKTIRENPVARTTDLLQKVFGAIKLP